MRQALSGVSARRSPQFRVRNIVPVQETARADCVPGAGKGLRALSPPANTDPAHAPTLLNFFPQPGYVEIRKGHKRHALLGTAAVESLLPYHGLTTGQDAMFAACSSVVSNVSSLATATASAALT